MIYSNDGKKKKKKKRIKQRCQTRFQRQMEATEQQRQTTIPDGESLCRGVENDNVLSSRSSDSFDYSSEATTHLCCSGCSNATILPKNFFFCSFLTVPHTFPQIPLAPLLRSLSLSYFSTSWAAVYAPIRSSNKTAHPPPPPPSHTPFAQSIVW